MNGLKAWLFWASLIAVFSFGMMLVVNPRDPGSFFFGLCFTLDAIGLATGGLGSDCRRSELLG